MAGNLYKRGDIWWGRIQVAGVERRRSLRTRTRAEARRRLERWRQDLEAAAYDDTPHYSWKEAVVRYCADVLPQSVKPATARRYLVSLRQVDALLAPLRLAEIDRKVIAQLAGRPGITNATRRRDLTAVSRVLAAAIQWGWIEENPARTYDRSMIRERRDPIVLPTDEEIAAVIARAPRNFARLIECLRLTGMRMEEAGGLEWRQVDLQRGEVTLYRTKTDQPRVLLLATPAGDATGTIAGTVRDLHSPYVFHHSGGHRYRNISSRFAEIRTRAGATFRLHDLRHRFAVDWLRGGGDIYHLQQHLGHSSVKTTEIYLRYVAHPSAQNTAQQRRSGASSSNDNTA